MKHHEIHQEIHQEMEYDSVLTNKFLLSCDTRSLASGSDVFCPLGPGDLRLGRWRHRPLGGLPAVPLRWGERSTQKNGRFANHLFH